MAPCANELCVYVDSRETQVRLSKDHGLTSIPPILKRPYVASRPISPVVSCLFRGLVQWHTQYCSLATQRLGRPFSPLFAINPVPSHCSFCRARHMSGAFVDGERRLWATRQATSNRDYPRSLRCTVTVPRDDRIEMLAHSLLE